MPSLRHLLTLLTLLPLTLAATLAQAEDWPAPIKQIEAKGAKILGKFDAPSGLTGYAAQYQNRGMALYLTADGNSVLAGNHEIDSSTDDQRGRTPYLNVFGPQRFRRSSSWIGPNGVCSVEPCTVAGRKFIGGEPMKPATNRLTGCS